MFFVDLINLCQNCNSKSRFYRQFCRQSMLTVLMNNLFIDENAQLMIVLCCLNTLVVFSNIFVIDRFIRKIDTQVWKNYVVGGKSKIQSIVPKIQHRKPRTKLKTKCVLQESPVLHVSFDASIAFCFEMRIWCRQCGTVYVIIITGSIPLLLDW